MRSTPKNAALMLHSKHVNVADINAFVPSLSSIVEVVEIHAEEVSKDVSVSLQQANKLVPCVPFVYPHEFCDKCLQMEDDFAAHVDAMFVESCPFDDFWFQSVVELGHELER